MSFCAFCVFCALSSMSALCSFQGLCFVFARFVPSSALELCAEHGPGPRECSRPSAREPSETARDARSARSARSARNEARDKFAFISDSALPAKPFAEAPKLTKSVHKFVTQVHRILGERDGSDFCATWLEHQALSSYFSDTS